MRRPCCGIGWNILARCGWLSNFAHHTFSHRLGIAKPEAAIYAHAAQGLATAPEHVLFIDDREDNIQAARQAGLIRPPAAHGHDRSARERQPGAEREDEQPDQGQAELA